MTLPTREAIAAIFRQYAATVVRTSWDDHHSEIAVDESFKAADALLARLRPALETKDDEWVPEPIGKLHEPCEQQRDALRVDLAEERKIVDRVWKALGVETYEAARGKSIDALIADLRADLRACAEALNRVMELPLSPDYSAEHAAIHRDACAALARPGVREALK